MSKLKSHSMKRMLIVASSISIVIIGAAILYVTYFNVEPGSSPAVNTPLVETVNINSVDDLKMAAEKVKELRQNDLDVDELTTLEASML